MFVRCLFERPPPSFEHTSNPAATDSTKFCAQLSRHLDQCLSTRQKTILLYRTMLHVMLDLSLLLTADHVLPFATHEILQWPGLKVGTAVSPLDAHHDYLNNHMFMIRDMLWHVMML